MIEEKWGADCIALLGYNNEMLAIATADPKHLSSGKPHPRRKFTIEIRVSDHPKQEQIQERCMEFIAERM